MKQKKIKELNDYITKKFYDNELVLGFGELSSSIMLIGEAPGAKEIEQKKPFVGQAGGNLDEFINILEIKRKDLYITNTVKFRPTRISKKTGGKINRPPTKHEIQEFKDILYKEISIIHPNIIVTLGNTALKAVLNNDKVTIGQSHGRLIVSEIYGIKYTVFALYHPAAIIYRRELKKIYLDDLQKLKNIVMKI